MLAHAKNLIKDASSRGYAIGAFNTVNLEVTQGIVNAANETSSPVLILVSETTIEYAGIKPITHIVSTIAKNIAVNVPVALHLDHGRNFHSLLESINAGFTSVHIDGSDLSLDENIMLTKQIVDYAHKKNVIVQGEVGQIKGVHKSGGGIYVQESVPTDPCEAEEFVKKTGVDTLAVSIGNSHGLDAAKLDFKLLEKIRARVKIPFVIHGGSGIPFEDVQKLIKWNSNVINIDSEIREVFSNELREFLKKNDKEIDPRKILAPARDAITALAKEKMDIFLSSGKAKQFDKFSIKQKKDD